MAEQGTAFKVAQAEVGEIAPPKPNSDLKFKMCSPMFMSNLHTLELASQELQTDEKNHIARSFFDNALESVRSTVKGLLDQPSENMADRTDFKISELQSVVSNLRAAPPTSVEGLRDPLVALLFVKKQSASGKGNFFEAADMRANEKAFDESRFQNSSFLSFFLNVLSWFALQWSPLYYAPYSAVINASMTGKSRSIAELACVGVFTIISCFRPQSEREFRPPRTPKIADWGTKKDQNLLVFTRQACQYFQGCLQGLLEFLKVKLATAVSGQHGPFKLNELTQEWRELREKEDRTATAEEHDHAKTYWGKVYQNMQVPLGLVDELQPQEKTGAEKAHQIILHFRTQLQTGLIPEIRKVLDALVPDLPEEKLHVLFAFDEARNLKKATSIDGVDNFVALRRAMRVLPLSQTSADLDQQPPVPAQNPQGDPAASPSGEANKEEREAPTAVLAADQSADKCGLNMFCLVTDTTSAIANLAPPREYVESERAGTVGIKLFHPFVNLMGFDCWWRSACDVLVPATAWQSVNPTKAIIQAVKTALFPQVAQDEKPGGGENAPAGPEQTEALGERDAKRRKIESPVAPRPFRELLSMEVLGTVEVASMQGRPGFFANLAARETDSDVVEFFELLKNKIVCANLKEEAAKSDVVFKLDQTQLMAVLVCIASIEISASSELASALSSGHLRPVAGVSRDRHLVYTLEISELLTAVTARRIMRDGFAPWSRMLAAFRETQLNSTTLPGFLGEFGGQVLLLMADEKARRNLRASDFAFYPVVQFLKALLGEQFVASLHPDVRSAFQGGYVRVLQFVKTFASLSRQMLLEYFLRGSAVYCRELQPGADLGIGIFFPQNTTPDAVAREPVTLERTSTLLVQVRNWSSPMPPGRVESAFSKLVDLHKSKPLTSELPRISLVLELHRSDAVEISGDEIARVAETAGGAETQAGTTKGTTVNLYREFSETDKILEIHAKGLSVADISVDGADRASADSAFRQLLKSIVDPRTVETIPAEFRSPVEHMFPVQPYMLEPTAVPTGEFPLVVRNPRTKIAKD